MRLRWLRRFIARRHDRKFSRWVASRPDAAGTPLPQATLDQARRNADLGIPPFGWRDDGRPY